VVQGGRTGLVQAPAVVAAKSLFVEWPKRAGSIEFFVPADARRRRLKLNSDRWDASERLLLHQSEFGSVW
jgi:hypothetical protein